MIYLALDQAVKTTGYAIFEDEKLVAYDNFTISSSKPIEQRLQMFIQKLNEIANGYGVQEIIFEDIQYQNNAETYRKLAYIQAAIIIWCYNRDFKFTILKPSHWRATLKSEYGFGFGRAREEQKRKAVEFCSEFMGVEATSDEADAICLGKAGLIEKRKTKSAF